MIVFRRDTTFPYLAVARRAGVPYRTVLALADELKVMQVGEAKYLQRSPLVDAVLAAMDAEDARRKAVAP